jgi:hypothetical protein
MDERSAREVLLSQDFDYDEDRYRLIDESKYHSVPTSKTHIVVEREEPTQTVLFVNPCTIKQRPSSPLQRPKSSLLSRRPKSPVRPKRPATAAPKLGPRTQRRTDQEKRVHYEQSILRAANKLEEGRHVLEPAVLRFSFKWDDESFMKQRSQQPTSPTRLHRIPSTFVSTEREMDAVMDLLSHVTTLRSSPRSRAETPSRPSSALFLREGIQFHSELPPEKPPEPFLASPSIPVTLRQNPRPRAVVEEQQPVLQTRITSRVPKQAGAVDEIPKVKKKPWRGWMDFWMNNE